MTRIIISRPLFVFVLSIFTLLLLWQDVNARGHNLPDGPRQTRGPEVKPVEAPAEVVTEVVPETVPEVAPEAAAAQEPSKGTMTLDGETRSFVVNTCYLGTMLTPPQVTGAATDDAGYTLNIRLMPGLASLQVSRTTPERSNTTYRNRDRPAAYQVDGTTVTLDASFGISSMAGKSSASLAAEKHSIQLSFDCAG